MSEKKNIMDSIKALESAIQKNVTRKHVLLRGEKITPSIMREVEELNKVILKKENQLKKANQKLREFDRV
jgi:hypothetical protein